MNAPRILGLDLSLTATGIAYSDGSTGTITTRASDRDRRLGCIRQHLAVAVRGPNLTDWSTRGADLVVIEDLPANAKSAGITGMVQGVARELLSTAEVPYALVPPAVLKKYATGKGTATKADMRMALYQRADLDIRDDNQVDAAWLRYMGMEWHGCSPLLLPKAQRDAVLKVTWPGHDGGEA